MGYKRIESAIHNLAHSFVSQMNWIDGEYIIDILPVVLHSIPDQQLKIQFPNGHLVPPGTYPERLMKSVGYYVQWYPDHMRREGVDPTMVRRAEIIIYVDRHELRCRAEAEDDRRKHYKIEVQ